LLYGWEKQEIHTKFAFPTPLEKYPARRPRRRQEENICMDVWETSCRDVKWIEMAQDFQWQALELTLKNHDLF
jgi:hypothetical protein